MRVLAKTCGRCGILRSAAEFDPRLLGLSNRASTCVWCARLRDRRARHGLTAEEKTAIALAQGGCAACGSMETGKRGWVVDHDHSCCPGERSCVRCRRGIVCTYCNSAMGYAKDDPKRLRAMADYLDRYQATITKVTP